MLGLMRSREAGLELEAPPAPARAFQVGLAVLLAYFVWNGLYFWPFIVDDTFISMRYARNLIDGHGLVYNLAERVEGFSNFSWVMISAGLMAVGLPVITTLKLLGLFSGVAAILLTYDLGRMLFGGRAETTLRLLVTVAFLAFNTGFALWTQGGLETEFFALLLVGTAWAFERELRRSQPFLLTCAFFALAWLTRPEAPIYAVYLVVRRALSLRERRLDRRDAAAAAFLAAALGAYEVWGLAYFGRLLPNTHLAKVGALEVGEYTSKLENLLRQPLLRSFFGEQGWGWALLAVIGLLGLGLRWRSLPCAAWLPTLCGTFFVAYAQDDWMPRYRLLVPILPFLALLLGHGIGESVELVRRFRGGRVALLFVLLVAGSNYVHHQSFAGHANRMGHAVGVGREQRDRWFLDVPGHVRRRQYFQERVALTMLQNLPENETMALRDLGFPGYLCGNPVWDTAGLMTPSVARARHDSTREASAAMFEDLLRVRPGCIFLVLQPRQAEQRPINLQLDAWLQQDERARAQYRRQAGREGATSVVTYWRNDLPEVDAERRLADARRRLPGYDPPAGLLQKTRTARDTR